MSGTTVPETWPRGQRLAPPGISGRPGAGRARHGQDRADAAGPGRGPRQRQDHGTARGVVAARAVRGTLSGVERAASRAVVATPARAYSVMSSPGPANLASYKLTMLAVGYKTAAPLFDGLALRASGR